MNMLYPLLLTLCIATSANTYAALNHELPELGGIPGELSAEQAYKLGRSWLRVFRNQVTTDDNPLLYEYLHNLTYDLIQHSSLKDTRVDLIVVNNSQLNAFAVPGGVVGIFNGLLLHAQHESELAAVVAHEIAHLQQNHYARSVHQARKRSLPTLAGILAGILLAATSNTEAGFALIYGSQAASIESQLRYSRRYELEADRTGMKILAQSGRDPKAIPNMFERMLATYQFRTRVPDFLLTHPVTERRIAEGRNLSRNYTYNTKPITQGEKRYQLMRTYAQVQLKQRDSEAFAAQLKKSPQSEHARYGYALALAQEEKYAQAEEAIKPLLKDTFSVPFVYTYADIATLSGKPQDALDMLNEARPLYPNSYSLERVRAHALNLLGKPIEATAILKKLTRAYPNKPILWVMLSESYGLSGNIIGVHEANMEYLILYGRLEEAKRRARYAARLAQGDHATLLRLRGRLNKIEKIRKELDALR